MRGKRMSDTIDDRIKVLIKYKVFGSSALFSYSPFKYLFLDLIGEMSLEEFDNFLGKQLEKFKAHLKDLDNDKMLQ